MVVLDKEGCKAVRCSLGITCTEASQRLYLSKSQFHNIEKGTPATKSLAYYTLALHHWIDTCEDPDKKKTATRVLVDQVLRVFQQKDCIIF